MLPSLEKMILSEEWVNDGKHTKFSQRLRKQSLSAQTSDLIICDVFFIIINPLLDFARIIAVMNKVLCILCVNILE